MNILVIDDDKEVLDGVDAFLSEFGYNVFTAKNGDKGLELLYNNHIDLIILDIVMPQKDGIDVLKEVRDISNVPIIVISSLKDEKIQLQIFDLKADDYVIKPFSLPVLYRKINVILNRHYIEHSIWKYKGARVDFTSYNVTLEGKQVDIKPKEVDVLKVLVEHPNQVLGREQIIRKVWSQTDEIPLERVIDVYIKNLRKKLHLDCIVTIKNVGYKIQL